MDALASELRASEDIYDRVRPHQPLRYLTSAQWLANAALWSRQV